MHRFIDRLSLPNLTGAKLIVGSDYRNKHGFYVDAFVLTTDDSLARWNQRRSAIRKRYGIHPKGLHYTNLDRSKPSWPAVEESLLAADELPGLCIVVLMHESLVLPFAQPVEDFLRGGHGITLEHSWKPLPLMEVVRITNWLTLFFQRFTRPHQAVHWLSDHEPWFKHGDMDSDQSRDVVRLLERAHRLNVKHQLGRTSLSTSKWNDDETHWAKDFVAISDLAAGAVSDALSSMDLSSNGDQLVLSTPTEMDGRAGPIAAWFWSGRRTPLGKVAVQIAYNGKTMSANLLKRHRR